MKQVNIHTDIEGVETYSITEYDIKGYCGRLIDTTYQDGQSYTDWMVYTGSEPQCQAYVKCRELGLTPEQIVEWFKKYTMQGGVNNVVLNYKETNNSDKFNIPNTSLWLYQVGEDIELISREPKKIKAGTPATYTKWDTKSEPVLASADWKGDIYMTGKGLIGEIK